MALHYHIPFSLSLFHSPTAILESVIKTFGHVNQYHVSIKYLKT